VHSCDIRHVLPAGAQVASLAGLGDLEARLKAAEPRWRAEFCSDADRPPGAPSLLLIGSSAAEANALIKRLPAFNEARPVEALTVICAVHLNNASVLQWHVVSCLLLRW